jgi:hypothetical protein
MIMNWNEINIDEMSIKQLLDLLQYVTHDTPAVNLYGADMETVSAFGDVNEDEMYVSSWEVENRLAQIETRLRYLLNL